MGWQRNLKGGGSTLQRDSKAGGGQLQGLYAHRFFYQLVYLKVTVLVVCQNGATSLSQVDADLVGTSSA